MIEIYTDGAYSPKRNKGGWAFAVVRDGMEEFHQSGGAFNTTNNIMELTAIQQAIVYICNHNYNNIIIYTDSQYCIGALSKGWKRNKNVELLKEIDLLLNKINVTFEFVKGHSINQFNNLCDELAVKETLNGI